MTKVQYGAKFTSQNWCSDLFRRAMNHGNAVYKAKTELLQFQQVPHF